MASCHLVLPMQVYGANVIGNGFVAGLPGMSAVYGFAHALEREIRDLLDEQGRNTARAEVMSVTLAIEELERDAGHARHVVYTAQAAGAATKGAPIVDERTARIRQTLILEIECNDEGRDALDRLLIGGELAALLGNLRYAGGTLTVRPRRIRIEASLAEALARVPASAFLLEDRSELLAKQQPGDRDRLDTLLRLISRPRRKPAATEGEHEQASAADQDYLGLLLPLAVGFVLLEHPRHRRGVRGGYPHAYAEPVIGLARARTAASVRAALSDPERGSPAISWMPDQDTPNSYIIKGGAPCQTNP
ncbi:CRISPR type I-F-associated protein Csy2 [Natronocella acetinitrilica]|uniref:CRISPR type I-F-associated protein Csy2 n=1 Tax=Natronocella acetinitrilica TaxID=414046 RepID=A0AAE3G2A6_9GAMM|nr:type I-F CRISPR-associated protein Csy2 [Natronocella acetinitrilica]MCP1674102.1 CRISPR type I-F-associated protein Csy2 [Natronocella acetinitrilica]